MKFKVMTFNIRCCDDLGGNPIWRRALRLDIVTKPYKADVIGFQEWRPKWEKHINRIYGKKYEIYRQQRADKDSESLVILWRKSKFECLDKGFFWLSDTPLEESRGWDEKYNCYRICAYAVLREKASGKTFTFMNTHFGFGDAGQVKSTELIAEFAKKISDSPTVVVGDFNMTPSSVGYASMIKHFTDVNTVTVNDMRNTYHGYAPNGKKCEHIDYCFVSGKIIPLGYKLIDKSVFGKYPSDHFGICTEYQI